MVALVLAVLSLAAAPAPSVRAVPVQDSPILLSIVPRPGTRRIVCALDAARPKACSRSSSLAARPGRHRIRVWTIDGSGRAGAKRTVYVVVPAPAPRALQVGAQPVGIATAGGQIWISNGSAGTVSRIDAATRRVVATVRVGQSQLGGIVATPTAVWVSEYGGTSVVRVDPARNAVTARVPVGTQPTGITVDGGGTVWVGSLDGRVTRIDPTTNKVLGRLTLPSGVSVPLFARGLVWVGLQNGTLVSIDPATAAVTGKAVTVAQDVDAIVDTPAGLWVSAFGGLAALVDPSGRTVERRIRLAGRGSGIAAAGSRVWVSDYDNGYVLGLDAATGSILAAVHTGGQPREAVVAAGVLWVCNQADGTVTPIPLAG